MPHDLISYEPLAAPKTPVAPTQTSRATPSVLLPSDLKASLAILNDRDFEFLLAEMIKEAARRRIVSKFLMYRGTRLAPRSSPHNQRKAPLTDLVRAAFKAGVKPAAIAR
jgi:hypothetical protein